MIKLIQSSEEFLAIRPQWDALVEETNAPHPFYLWNWLNTWWLHFNDGKELCIITSWQGDQMDGAWPLVLNKFAKKMMPMRALRNLGENEVDISGWIIPNNDPVILNKMVAQLMEMRKEWDIIDIHDIPYENIKNLPLNLFFDNHYEISYQMTMHLDVSLNSSWDDYFNSRSSRLKKKVRKSQLALSKDYSQSFAIYSDLDIPEELITHLVQISQHSKFPMLHQSDQISFIKDLFKKIYPYFTILYLNGEPAAFDYGFTSHNSIYIWRGGYNLKYSDYSIGQLLLVHNLEHSFKEGKDSYDFLRGDEWYKHQWSTRENSFINLRIIQKHIRPLIAYSWIPRLTRKLRSKKQSDGQTILEPPWKYLSTQESGTWKEIGEFVSALQDGD